MHFLLLKICRSQFSLPLRSKMSNCLSENVELPKKTNRKTLNDNESKRKNDDRTEYQELNHIPRKNPKVGIDHELKNTTNSSIETTQHRAHKSSVLDDSDSEDDANKIEVDALLPDSDYNSFFVRKILNNTQIDASIAINDTPANIPKYQSKSNILGDLSVMGFSTNLSSTQFRSVDAPNEVSVRHKWTPAMDTRLKEAWTLFGKQWKRVAEHVGHNKNRSQCQHRWAVYVGPQEEEARRFASIAALNHIGGGNHDTQTKKMKTGPWSDDEVTQLQHLVETNRNSRHGADDEGTTNWVLVAQEAGRAYKECRNKWKALVAPRGKKGGFTPAEDRLVMERVAAWGSKGPGLWTSLEREVGRRGKSICRRWQNVLQHIVAAESGIEEVASTVILSVSEQEPPATDCGHDEEANEEDVV